jgi:hypothetical protein
MYSLELMFTGVATELFAFEQDVQRAVHPRLLSHARPRILCRAA